MLYDRFTDRARKVMAYARQEAQRFNHDYIGTEHILLGLIKEGSGVAANVLRNLDVDIKCKASGTIVELPFDVSDMVKEDQLLMKLDPVDEQRVVAQASVTLQASQAKLVKGQSTCTRTMALQPGFTGPISSASSRTRTEKSVCGGEDSMGLITTTGRRKAAFVAFEKMAKQ